MRKFALSVLVVVALATMSADAIDFKDPNVWKTISSPSFNRTFRVFKNKGKVYINGDMYDDNGQLLAFFTSWLYKNLTCKGMAFDKAGNIWVATDKGVFCQSSTDTTRFYSDAYVTAIYYDADSNRIIIGKYKESYAGQATIWTISTNILSLDSNGKPIKFFDDTIGIFTTAPNFVKQIVVANGQIWAITSYNLSCHADTGWVENAQFPNWNSVTVATNRAVVGDVDRHGNLWLSFERLSTSAADSMDCGLAKFDGHNWTEYLVTRDNWTKGTGDFGFIGFDADNTLWYLGDGIGKVDLSTMSREKIPFGTYKGFYSEDLMAMSITDEGQPIFSGGGIWVEKISSNAIRTSIVVCNLPGTDFKIIGIFDILGRKTINANSFSAYQLPVSSGMRIIANRNKNGFKAVKTINTR